MLPLAGPRILFGVVLVEVLLCGAVLSTPEPGEAELRAVIRLTAMVSLLCFLMAFTASSLARRWPSAGTRWLVVNRRWVGLSFAASHALHGIAIWQWVQDLPGHGAAVPLTTRVVGGLGYVVIALLAVTSNDPAVRLLGPQRWSALHTAGVYFLWFVFAATYGGAALESVVHGVATALLVAALGLRLLTHRRQRVGSSAGIGTSPLARTG